MKKRFLAILLLILTAITSVSCTKSENQKLQIVATLFPQYDFARIIAGDKADVTMLLPYGSDSHSYEPSIKDMARVSGADLFLYTGKDMEPWAESLLESADIDKSSVPNITKNITLIGGTDGHFHDSDGHEHGHSCDYDPHIWTSPKNAIIMADNILESLCGLDSENTDYYKSNAEKLKSELEELDNELLKISETGKDRTAYFGGKFAFVYMFTDYNLEYESAYKGCSEQSEPSIKTISELCERIKNDGAQYIFCEEMSESKVASGIAEETGTTLLVLHSCHNLSKAEAECGESYVSLMKKNINNLKLALETE